MPRITDLLVAVSGHKKHRGPALLRMTILAGSIAAFVFGLCCPEEQVRGRAPLPYNACVCPLDRTLASAQVSWPLHAELISRVAFAGARLMRLMASVPLLCIMIMSARWNDPQVHETAWPAKV